MLKRDIMKKNTYLLLLLILITIASCENDDDGMISNENIQNDSIKLNYSKTFPGIVDFMFVQSFTSNDSANYQNKLTIKNLSNENLNLTYQIVNFKENMVFDNVEIIESNNISLSNNKSDSVSLNTNSQIFSDSNTTTSLISVNDISHSYSGVYRGDIDIFSPDGVFINTFDIYGWIDWEGQMYILNTNNSNISFSYIVGNLNSENIFIGEVYDYEENKYGEIENFEGLEKTERGNITGRLLVNVLQAEEDELDEYYININFIEGI